MKRIQGNRRMGKRIAAIVLALVLILSVSAFADVYITGKVFLRRGPGKNYSEYKAVQKGDHLTYLGQQSVDERGVIWYKVSYKGEAYWVSSKYAKLSGGKPDPVPKPGGSGRSGQIVTTGKVNLRSGPGLDYGKVGSVSSGSYLTYLGQQSTDNRGVVWYMVDHNGACWISSKYASLTGGGSKGNTDVIDDKTVKNAKELSGYYLADLRDTARVLGLSQHHHVVSEAPDQYTNGVLTIMGDLESNGLVTGFMLTGGGFKIYGVTVGMRVENAKQILSGKNLKLDFSGNKWITGEHPSGPKSEYDSDGYDSCILFEYQNGIITEIQWSSYTG